MISYKGIATLLFGSLVEKYADTFSFVKRSLPKADIKISYRVYMSVVFFSSLIAAFCSSFVAYIFTIYFKFTLLQMIFILFFSPLVTFLAIFILLCYYPFYRANIRKRNIETNLPFVLSHMASIAEAGIPPHLIFKLVSRFKEYGELAKEMEKINRNIESFGLNPVAAVREVANRTPSEALKEVLLGYVSTIEAGGSVTNYLKEAGKGALFEWRSRREMFLTKLSTYAEIYIGILVAAPLFIVSIFAAMAIVQPVVAGWHVFKLMEISIYGLIPLLNLSFLLFLKGVEVEV